MRVVGHPVVGAAGAAGAGGVRPDAGRVKLNVFVVEFVIVELVPQDVIGDGQAVGVGNAAITVDDGQQIPPRTTTDVD